MRRVDREKALETLDEIERLTSLPGKDGHAIEIGIPGIDGNALDLMVKVARLKGGLKLLVEKYSASQSVIIVSGLVLILVRRAESTNLKNAYLLFEFIENLQRKDNSSILVTTLTAIRHQIGIAKVWHHTRMPESLYPFLQHCLDFTGAKANWIHRGLSDDVQMGAVDVLRTMCEVKTFDFNFSQEQRRWIEAKVGEIGNQNTNHPIFQTSVSDFLNCLRTTS